MGQPISLIARVGGCNRCHQPAAFYGLTPGFAERRPCPRCRRDLTLTDAGLQPAWLLDERHALLLTGETVRPPDFVLHERRLALLQELGPDGRACLGIVVDDPPHGLVVLLTVAENCPGCGVSQNYSCLTDFWRRRTTCGHCQRKVGDLAAARRLAAMTPDGVCRPIKDPHPVTVETEAPPDRDEQGLIVLTPADLELLGLKT